MATNLIEYIMGIEVKGAEKGLDRVSKEAKKTEKQLDKTEKQGNKTGAALKSAFKAVGIAAAAGTASVLAAGFAILKLRDSAIEFTMGSVDMINDLGDIGNRSGVAADTIGALKAAFHASGQEAGAVVSVLDVTAKRLGQLSKGSKEAQDAFNKYGVATHDLEGNMRSNNDILLDAMSTIQGLEDTSLRSRAAIELLGRGGQQLSQALGAGDFNEFLAFVNEFGAIAGPRAAKSAALVQDSISLNQISMEGFREEAVLALGLMDKYQKSLNISMAFWAGLKKVVEENEALFRGLGSGIQEALVSMVEFFALALSGAQSTSKGLKGLLENVFRISQGLLDLVIAPLESSFYHLRNLMSYAGYENIAKALEKGRASVALIREYTSSENEKGFELLQTAIDGASNALDRFNKITGGTKKNASDAGDGVEDLAESVEYTTEQIDHLAESANILNSVLAKLGVPKQLQIGGFKEVTAQVEQLAMGLNELGMVGAFGQSAAFGKNKKQIGFDFRAQEMATALFKVAPKIGAAIAAASGIFLVASKLGKMGDTQEEIKESLIESAQDRAKNLERGLQALPDVLRRVLPEMLVILADSIIFGIAKAFAERVNLLLQFLRSILTREGRQERRQGVTLGDRANEFLRRIGVLGDIAFEGMRAGGRIPSARSGLAFTGDQAGLALLHKNEFVVPESGQAPQTVRRTMGNMGGGVNVIINAQIVERSAVDEIVRQIERRFRDFGSSTSPLFGS